jgi:hypothetical protein
LLGLLLFGWNITSMGCGKHDGSKGHALRQLCARGQRDQPPRQELIIAGPRNGELVEQV